MKLQAFNRQVSVFLDDLTSPKARSARLAKVADAGIKDIRKANAASIGSDPPPTVFVDGRKGAALESVKPDGVIVAEFAILYGVLEWIGEQLILESPRLTGRYMRSHVVEADGVEVDPDGTIPDAAVYRFVNRQPYAAKIEPDEIAKYGSRRRNNRRENTRTVVGKRRALSPQAPDGVYMAISAVAAMRFGNIAKITYSRRYYDHSTGVSHPSIVVRPR